MRVAVVSGENHVGCSVNYFIWAFSRLGHQVVEMRPNQYFETNPDDFDLFWGQDSGDPIDFRQASNLLLKKTSMNYWDSRFNSVQRGEVGDDLMAKYIADRGGWIFEAQTPDLNRIRANGVTRSSWLPISADTTVWLDTPAEEKIYSLCFVGNCYDGGRGTALNYARKFGLHWPGANSVFNQDAARLYRQSKIVFHASTFYNLNHDKTGERVDWDLTMRPYEALACGVPFITNPLYDLDAAGFVEGFHYFLYSRLEDMDNAFERAMQKVTEGGADYARQLREFVVSRHTYESRIVSALEVLTSAGVLR